MSVSQSPRNNGLCHPSQVDALHCLQGRFSHNTKALRLELHWVGFTKLLDTLYVILETIFPADLFTDENKTKLIEVVFNLSISVKWLVEKIVSKMTYSVSSSLVNPTQCNSSLNAFVLWENLPWRQCNASTCDGWQSPLLRGDWLTDICNK